MKGDRTGLWYTTIKGTKKTLVFLHGAGSNHSIWKPYLSAFKGHRIMLIDLPGHGKSQSTPYVSIAHAAHEVSKVLQKAGVRNAALIGHSFGGLVGLEASLHVSANRLNGLIVTSPVAKHLSRPPLVLKGISRVLNLLHGKTGEVLPFQDYSVIEDKPPFLFPLVDFRGTTPSIISMTLHDAIEYEPAWKAVSIPTLILLGNQDVFIRKKELEIAVENNKNIAIQTLQSHHLLISHARNDVIKAVKGFII